MDRSVELLLHGFQYKKMLESIMNPIQEKYGLRKVDIEVLNYLSHCEERNTARDIIRETMLNKGHISQSVDRLQKMNMLAQIPDQEDRRYVHLAPTENAKALGEEIREAWATLHQKIFEGVTEEEIEVLKNVANKIRNNLEKELK